MEVADAGAELAGVPVALEEVVLGAFAARLFEQQSCPPTGLPVHPVVERPAHETELSARSLHIVDGPTGKSKLHINFCAAKPWLWL